MPFVPESVLKKRHAQQAIQTDKDAASKKARAGAKAKKDVIFKRAEKYAAEYKQQELSLIHI